MTEDQIRHMVNRFLGWKLPANFNPDNGVSFNPIAGENGPHPFKREPSGTNLFDATQATEMVRYMIDGIPARPDAGGGVRVKPLEWHDNRHAQSILGVYSINSWSSGAFSILRPNKGYPDNNSFPTVDEAKAAAQADYEQRILSALSTTPVAAESKASVEARLREAHIEVLHGLVDACAANVIGPDKTKGSHLISMIDVIERTPSMPIDKIARWTGFIQGVLCARNIIDVDAERDRTRPILSPAVAKKSEGGVEGHAERTSDPTAERGEIDPKVLLLLQMVERAKGEIDTTDNPLLNFFCDDRGRETDTYNLAIDAGYLRSSFNDLFETSRAYLTDAGRAILAALDGGAGA